MLQLLQWQKKRRGERRERWVLKTPGASGLSRRRSSRRLPRRARDPHAPRSRSRRSRRVRASTRRSGGCTPTRSTRAEVGRQWLERMSWTNRRALAARDRHARRARALHRRLVPRRRSRDPLAQIERIYRAPGSSSPTRRATAMDALARRGRAREARQAHLHGRAVRPHRGADPRRVRRLHRPLHPGAEEQTPRSVASDRDARAARARARGARARPSTRSSRKPTAASASTGSRTIDPSPDMRSVLRLGVRRGDVLGRDLVARTRTRCAPRHLHHAARAPARGHARCRGSRWGIDNPDSIYRVIPISGDERYLIRGRVAERRMTENYFTLWDANMNTVDVLSGHDLVLGRRSHASRSRSTASPPTGAAESHPLVARGARVLHPRRDARLGDGRAERARDRAPGRAADDAAADASTSRPSSRPRTCSATRTSPTSSSRGMLQRQPERVRARVLGRQGRRAAQAGLHRRDTSSSPTTRRS